MSKAMTTFRLYLVLALAFGLDTFSPPLALAADVDLSLSFSAYLGPAGYQFRDSNFVASVNGTPVPVDEALGSYTTGEFTGFRGRLDDLVGGGSELRLLNRPNSVVPMTLRFEPAELRDVELGSTVRLGDIVFVNGLWNNDEIPTRIDFEIEFESSDPVLAALDFAGQLILKSNLPVDQVSGEPNEDAGADWIAFANAPEIGSFRVYDFFEVQGRFTNVGRVELWATLGSGTFESFRNPRDGFLTTSVVSDPKGRSATPEIALFTSVLPASRSAQVGETVTAFATVINAGRSRANQCKIVSPPGLAANFFYQATDPFTNAPMGERDTPQDIDSGSTQTFFFGLTPSQEIAPIDLALNFNCANGAPAASFSGLNTLLFSASSNSMADIVALAATTSNDGIVKLDSSTRAGAFSVASVNVGGESNIFISVDTNGASLPLGLSFCETNSITGACLGPPVLSGETLERSFVPNVSPTFAVFVAASQPVALDPASSRVFLRFSDAQGVARGSTSVAVQSLLPVASAGSDVQVRTGGAVQLAGSSESVDGVSIETAGWTQVSGPVVDTGPGNTATLAFTAPQVQCATTLVFAYSASYNNGLNSSDSVSVRVTPVVGGFSVNAGEEAVLLSAFAETLETSQLPRNKTGLLGSTNLDTCNLVSAGWQQTAGTPVETSSFAQNFGLNIVAPEVSADETLEFEFSVTAADGQVETDRATVKLAATRTVSGNQLPTQFYRPFYANDQELFVRDFNNFYVLDRVTAAARKLADERVFLLDDGSSVPSGVSATDPVFVPDTGKFINWVDNFLIEIDPDRVSSMEPFRVGGAGLCCHNSFAASSTDLFVLISRDFGENILFRQNYASEDNLTQLATVLGNRFDLVADDTTVYLHSRSSDNPSMVAYDLASGLQTSVLSIRTSDSSAGAAPAFSATKLYWEAGGALYEIDRATKAVRVVAPEFDVVQGLAALGDWVYAIRRDVNAGMDTLLRVGISSGQTEALATLPFMAGLVASTDAIYVAVNPVSGGTLAIHRYIDGGGLELFANTTANNARREGIKLSGSKLVVLGSHITFVDLSTGEDLVVSKLNNFDDIDQAGNAIWLSDGGRDAVRIPLDVVPEPPTVLGVGDGQGFVREQVLADNVLYFLDGRQDMPGGPTTYLVRAIDSDGGNLRTLFSGDNPFKELGVYGNSLVFLCNKDCGVDNVALVTLPTTGGTPTLIRTVGDDVTVSHGDARLFFSIQNEGTFAFDTQTGVVTDIPFVHLFGGRLLTRGDVLYYGRDFSDPLLIFRYELGAEGSLTAPQRLVFERSVQNSNILESMWFSGDELIFSDGDFRLVSD